MVNKYEIIVQVAKDPETLSGGICSILWDVNNKKLIWEDCHHIAPRYNEMPGDRLLFFWGCLSALKSLRALVHSDDAVVSIISNSEKGIISARHFYNQNQDNEQWQMSVIQEQVASLLFDSPFIFDFYFSDVYSGAVDIDELFSFASTASQATGATRNIDIHF